MSYFELYQQIDQDELARIAAEVDEGDVRRALGRENLNIRDFLALISPAADPYMEQIAERARKLTLQRFGRTLLMYAPLYLSNYCTNKCVYCGFNHDNQVTRLCLSPDQAAREAEAIAAEGFRHLLLVSGEDSRYVGVEYLEQLGARLKGRFSSIGIEVQPLQAEEYARLVGAGIEALTVYQETYNRQRYAQVHPAGRKRDFAWRLDTPDRAGRAGMRKIGIGALLGLSDYAVEAANVALHARYLMRTYWRTQVSISFPRLREAAGAADVAFPVEDRDLFRLICAYRLFTTDAVLVLSTRESAAFRDQVFPYGITQMSAGSRTNPGGYAGDGEESAEEQFHIQDERSPSEVARMLRSRDYEAVWKDWDPLLA